MSARLHTKVESTDKNPLVLVAGGAGFLGSALCGSLLQQNLKVFCIDNLSSGNKGNIENLIKNPNFEFHKYNLNETKELESLSPNYIFHLAGVEEYINGIDVSLETLLVNSLGTKNLLDLAIKTKAKFLLVSSLSVYEGLLSGSSLKKDFGLSPKDVQKYTHHEAKRFSEALVAEYFRKFDLDARVTRIKDCYGPNMPLEEGSPINRLIKQTISGSHLTIEGDGLETIYPTYVDDIIFGFQKAMFSQNTTGKIFTLVNPKEHTLLSLAYSIQKIINHNLKIEFLHEKNEFKFSKKTPEIEETKKELGWSIKTSWEEGLQKTIDSFKTQNRATTDKYINFDNKQEEQTIKLPTNSKQEEIVEEKTNAEEISEEVIKLSQQNVIKTETPFVTEVSIPEQKKKFNLPKINPKFVTVFLSFILLTLALTFPILSLGAQTFLGAKNLDNAKNLLENGKIDESIKESEKAEKNFFIAKKTSASLSWVFTIIKLRKKSSIFSESLEVGENLASGVRHIASSIKILKNIKEDLLLGFAPNTEDKITEAVLEMDLADEKLALVQALANEKNPCPFNNFLCEKTKTVINEIPKSRSMIIKAKNIINVLPQILGANGKKTYLVLLQNNMELRGSGGFIGSYGFISVENGKVLDSRIEDIYSIDGQLKGKIDPPDEVLHYLGQPSWFLRDSNISPDFVLSAKRAIWFFEKETGNIVDGVVTIDLSFAQDLLKVIGPINVPDYKLKITADNLFLEAEKNSESNFFPGSTQKKDFLGSFGRNLLAELGNRGDKKIIPLLQKASLSIEKKHLQIYSNDKEIEDVIKIIGAGGQVEDDNCEDSKNCTKSSLLIAENNFGANKANFFVKRKILRDTVIGKEGEVREKVKVIFQNDSPSESWPAGTYKNYMKIYAPLGSKLLSFDMGENKKASISAALTEDALKNLNKDEFLVTESSESGKTTWGTLVQIPIKTKKTIEIYYELPEKIPLSQKDFSLEIYQQKQSGTLEDPYEQTVAYPAFLTVDSLIPKEGIVKEPIVSYNTNLSVDRSLTIKFKK